MASTVLEEMVAGRAPGVLPLTVEQVHRMLEAGILPEDASVELIDGLLVRKDRSDPGGDPLSHGQRHAQVLKRLIQLDRRLAGRPCRVQVQLPVTLAAASEPEPDVAIIRGSPEDYGRRHPGPGDVLLVVEVALSSLLYDRSTKLRLHAAAGIPQYWIVDGRDDRLEVYSDSDPAEATYRQRRELRPGENASFEIGAGAPVLVDVGELLRR